MSKKNSRSRRDQRRKDAEERQAARNNHTAAQQLKLLAEQGYTSGKEYTRLLKEVASR